MTDSENQSVNLSTKQGQVQKRRCLTEWFWGACGTDYDTVSMMGFLDDR